MIPKTFITSSGEEIPIIFGTRRCLKNITIRPKTIPRREIHISKPFLTSNSVAVRFLDEKQAWLDSFFAKIPQKMVLKNRDVVNFLGRDVLLRHDSTQRADFYSADNSTLIIGGLDEMFTRRVRDFIKREFLSQVKSIIKTAPPEFRPKSIAVRDTTSRWGSCSSIGTISFSWRLAFAPPEVMRYVIMHELAHLKHMDHSPAFWATVAGLYGDGMGCAKLWLSKNGQSLHNYF